MIDLDDGQILHEVTTRVSSKLKATEVNNLMRRMGKYPVKTHFGNFDSIDREGKPYRTSGISTEDQYVLDRFSPLLKNDDVRLYEVRFIPSFRSSLSPALVFVGAEDSDHVEFTYVFERGGNWELHILYHEFQEIERTL